ncbi:MAG: hypothetical protein HY722_08545 [Planctomycetes bacterium]|nr:hypothetical protein [Planctomycetota bacterium]
MAPARRIARVLGRAWADERGQSLVFGAITAFTLVLFVSLAFHVGRVTASRVRVQNAADASAYAGALVEANGLSAIAWLNDGMAYTYYRLMRYAVDYVVFDTLNGFLECSPPADDLIAGGAEVWAVRARYQLARQRYEDWVVSPGGGDGRGKRWIKRMGRLARGIATLTPAVIREEVWRVAQANGAERVAMLPEAESDWDNGYFVFRDGARPIPVFRADDVYNFAVTNATRRIGQDELPYWGGGGSESSWFDPETGNLWYRGAYHQTRVCWHPQDLGHVSMGPPLHVTDDYRRFYAPFGPNHHWHHEHFHLTSDFPFFLVHENGHYPPEMEDPKQGPHEEVIDIPDWYLPHHAIEECPLCAEDEWEEDGRSDVRVWPQAGTPRQNRYQERDLEDILDGPMRDLYMPLVVNPEALGVGINVGVYSPPLAGGTFEAGFGDPDWGYVALASAHVGIDDGGRVQEDLAGWASDTEENLYTRVRWGAKLVSTRSPHTYLGRPASELWQGLAQARWREDPMGPPDPSVRVALARMADPASGSPFQFGSGLDAVVSH